MIRRLTINKLVNILFEGIVIILFTFILFLMIFLLSGCQKSEHQVDVLNASQMQELPIESSIKKVNGNGKRTLIVISKLDCPFCLRLHDEIKNVDDVTVYTMLVPTQRTKNLIGSIYCDKNPAKKAGRIFDQLTNNRKESKKLFISVDGNLGCQNFKKIEKINTFAKSIPITLYPALINQHGDVLYGLRDKKTIDSFINLPPRISN